MDFIKIFISSTKKDLKEYRRLLGKLCYENQTIDIMMEEFGASPNDPTTVCFNKINECDIFVGIYAFRYGYIPRGGNVSITEMEFDYARKTKKPMLCYLVDKEEGEFKYSLIQEDFIKELNTFKLKIENQEPKITVYKYKTLSDLGLAFTRDLQALLKSEFKKDLIINEAKVSLLKPYLSHILSLYNRVNLFRVSLEKGIDSKEVKLSETYVPLKLTPEREYNTLESKNSESNLLSKKEVNIIEYRDKESIGFYMNMGYRKFVILGNAGQGKSVICQWLMTALASEKIEHNTYQRLADTLELKNLSLYPILFKCRELNFGSKIPRTLYDLIKDSLAQKGFDENFINPFLIELKNIAHNGKLCLIIDGVDEIENDVMLNNFCDALHDISNKHEKKFFILTSRVFGYKDIRHKIGSSFTHLRIENLDNSARKLLAANISKLEIIENGELNILMDAIEKENISNFASSPLLLTNLCLIFCEQKFIPENLSQLFLSSIELMFKRAKSVDIQIKFDNAVRRELAWFCYYLVSNNSTQFTAIEFENLILEYRKNHKFISKLSPFTLLMNLTFSIDLITSVGKRKHKGEYTEFFEFKHNSFKEFLAGYAIILECFEDFQKGDDLATSISKVASNFQNSTINLGYIQILTKKINDIWLEPIKFAVLLADEEDAIRTLKLLIENNEKNYNHLEQEARTRMAAYCIADIEENATIYPVIKDIFISLLFSLSKNDFKSFNSPKTHYDFIFTRILTTKWKDFLLVTIVEYLKKNYQGDDNGGRVLTLFVNSIESETVNIWENNKKDFIKEFNENAHFDLYLLGHIVNIAYFVNLPFDNPKKIKIESYEIKIIIEKLLEIIETYDTIKTVFAMWALKYLSSFDDLKRGVWKPGIDEISILKKCLAKTNDLFVFNDCFKIINSECTNKITFKKIYAFEYAQYLDQESEKPSFNNIGVINNDINLILNERLISGNKFIKRMASVFLAQHGVLDNDILNILASNLDWFSIENILTIIFPYFYLVKNEDVVENIVDYVINDNETISFSAFLILSLFESDKTFNLLLEKYKDLSSQKQAAATIILNKLKPDLLEGFIVNDRNQSDKNYFENKIITYLANRCVQVKGKDTTGRIAHYVALIFPDKSFDFYFHKPGDSYDLADYGYIIHSLYGEKISFKTYIQFSKKFGFSNIVNTYSSFEEAYTEILSFFKENRKINIYDLKAFIGEGFSNNVMKKLIETEGAKLEGDFLISMNC